MNAFEVDKCIKTLGVSSNLKMKEETKSESAVDNGEY